MLASAENAAEPTLRQFLPSVGQGRVIRVDVDEEIHDLLDLLITDRIIDHLGITPRLEDMGTPQPPEMLRQCRLAQGLENGFKLLDRAFLTVQKMADDLQPLAVAQGFQNGGGTAGSVSSRICACVGTFWVCFGFS